MHAVASVGEVCALSLAPSVDSPPIRQCFWPPAPVHASWRADFRSAVLDAVGEFVDGRAAELDVTGFGVAGDILAEFVSGGKCLRSTFMYPAGCAERRGPWGASKGSTT